MSQKHATLKDLAARLGVSTTTIHRALTGKPGISDQLRTTIQNLAVEMNYQPNLAASALKRNELHIAVLLPEPFLDNRYYYASLWAGIHKFMENAGNFNAVLDEYYYPLLPGAHGEALKSIYQSHLDKIDGFITIGIKENQSSYFIDQFNRAHIPCVILGTDLYGASKLCCVKSHDIMAGNMAAELFTTFLPDQTDRTILLTGNPLGQSAMIDQFYNLNAFQDYLSKTRSPVKLQTAYCTDINQLEEMISPFLSSREVLPYGIYASSARYTVKICEILEKHHLEKQIKIVGNDHFPESIEYLRKGTLTAIIDKKISQQSYTAAKILLEYLSLGRYPERSVMEVQPDILIRSSLSASDN